ncbi:hypothetical protein V6R21_15340 [Limibacter armeniacum]|uniref:hypothetical protein n=1 Tax=Limibacter armeniacum TaxID=466084 RepID=UPI002FE57D88
MNKKSPISVLTSINNSDKINFFRKWHSVLSAQQVTVLSNQASLLETFSFDIETDLLPNSWILSTKDTSFTQGFYDLIDGQQTSKHVMVDVEVSRETSSVLYELSTDVEILDYYDIRQIILLTSADNLFDALNKGDEDAIEKVNHATTLLLTENQFEDNLKLQLLLDSVYGLNPSIEILRGEQLPQLLTQHRKAFHPIHFQNAIDKTEDFWMNGRLHTAVISNEGFMELESFQDHISHLLTYKNIHRVFGVVRTVTNAYTFFNIRKQVVFVPYKGTAPVNNQMVVKGISVCKNKIENALSSAALNNIGYDSDELMISIKLQERLSKLSINNNSPIGF